MPEQTNLPEEKELDNFINSLNKRKIAVPEELASRIEERIEVLKAPKNNFGRKAIAVCAILCFLFVGAVKISPEFAAYASNIPGLQMAVEWLQGDKGIKNAKEHGYQGIGPVTVEEDGYILTLDNIFFDEDRIRFSAVVKGEKVIQMEGQKDSTVQEKAVRAEDFFMDEPSERWALSVSFIDFIENPGSMLSYDGDGLTAVVEKPFKAGEAKDFLASSPEHLNVSIKIHNGKETIHKFNTIQIPINNKVFKPSKTFKQDKGISLKHANITIKDLTISPTRMRLDIRFDMEEGYIFTGFENPYLKDQDGTIYKPEGLVSTHNNFNERTIYFVPSTYFDDMEQLYFCFDGIRVGSEKGQEFTLSLDDDYPKKVEYMGEEIIIEKVKFLQKGEKTKLTIFTKLPSKDILHIQGFNIQGYEGTKEWGSYENEDENGNIQQHMDSSFYIERKENYEVKFNYPGYLIKTFTTYPLDIN